MIWVLYENADWLPALTGALDDRGLAFEPLFVDGGSIDLSTAPPDGVFINRMSPSSHTRGHQGGVQFLREYLGHLEAHDRPVINGSRAFELEVSKVKQDIALRRHGVRTPRTMGVVGSDRLKAAARTFDGPFITKHNQGGKGLGIQLFKTLDSFDAYVDGGLIEPDPGGVWLLQQYIESPEPFITRVEIVDGRFQYAIASSTVNGFQLCPADACAVQEAEFCPVDGGERFRLREDFGADDPLVAQLCEMMAAHGIDVAGIEFVEDHDGHRYVYDINGTTNYNSDVEAAHGLSGMAAIAALAERKLRRL